MSAGKKQDLTEGQPRPTEIRCLDLWYEANGWTILTDSELMCRKLLLCNVTSLVEGCREKGKRAFMTEFHRPYWFYQSIEFCI